MAHAPSHPCSQPGCGVLVGPSLSHCPAHTPRPYARAPLRRVAVPGWEALRARVLREQPQCALCGAPSTSVDHRVPRSLGGSSARDNLRGLCDRCHGIKTGREGVAARLRGNQPVSPTRLFSGAETPGSFDSKMHAISKARTAGAPPP